MIRSGLVVENEIEAASLQGIPMGRVFPIIDDQVAEFIRQQQMFFVATAPLLAEGHINISPKGLDSFRILDERTVAYLDLVGSGIETVAHIKENGRIAVMFCAVGGPPKILRLHGRGQVIEPNHEEFVTLWPLFPNHSGVRSIIRIHCTRISDSCGFGVPLFEFQGHRTQLLDWAERKGQQALEQYQREKNARSVDGLPGISVRDD
jgi:hypothetical protein